MLGTFGIVIPILDIYVVTSRIVLVIFRRAIYFTFQIGNKWTCIDPFWRKIIGVDLDLLQGALKKHIPSSGIVYTCLYIKPWERYSNESRRPAAHGFPLRLPCSEETHEPDCSINY